MISDDSVRKVVARPSVGMPSRLSVPARMDDCFALAPVASLISSIERAYARAFGIACVNRLVTVLIASKATPAKR